MPFQSEKQRRYLWANEPEIARDWTDTYGSRVQKNNGGIMHNFANYAHDDGSNVSVPRSFQARPHSDQVNLAYITPEEQGILQALKPDTPHEGPMGIPNYDSFDAQGNFRSGQEMSAAESGDKNAFGRDPGAQKEAQDYRSAAIAAGAGQTVNPGLFGPRHRPGISKQDLGAAKAFAPNAYRATRGSPFGIGNLFRGAMGMFGGWPGKIGSMLSHIDPRQLRGINSLGGYNTQKQYEDARKQRINEKRIANILGRKAPITKAMQERLTSLGYTGEMPGVGSTELSRAIDRDDFDINERIQDTSFEQNLPEEIISDNTSDDIDLTGYDFTDTRLPSSHPDYWKKQDIDYGVRDLRKFNEWDEWNKSHWEKDTREIPSHPDYWPKQNLDYGFIEDYKDPNDPFHIKRKDDYGRYSKWIDEENPINYYYPLRGNEISGINTLPTDEALTDEQIAIMRGYRS